MLKVLERRDSTGRLRRSLILIHDLIVVTSALPISIYLRENFDPGPQHVVPAVYGTTILFLIALFVFRIIGVQQNIWRYSSSNDLLKVAKALSIITAIFIPVMFLFDRLDSMPRSVLVIFWFVAFAGLCSTRIIYTCLVTSHTNRSNKNQRQTACRLLVLANLQSSSTIIHSLTVRHGRDAQIVGLVNDQASKGRTLLGAEILGQAKQLGQIVSSLDVEGCFPHAIILGDNDAEIQDWLRDHLSTIAGGITIFDSFAADRISHFIENRPTNEQIFSNGTNERIYLKIKRLIDIVASITALILLLPILALIISLSCILNGAPIFFVQVRAGRHLREFRLLKFRTMRPPIDGAGSLLEDHQRITRLGSFLRASRLDELPQFWNVLRGDMSLIGPRPLLRRDMPNDTDVLAERYSVRPGITGWAQVNGGHKIENAQKMPLDIYYIRHASFMFDLNIILMTIKMMLFGEQVDHSAITHAKASVVSQ